MPRMGLSGSHSGPCARCASTTRSKNKLFKHHAASIRWPFAGFSGLWRRHIMHYVDSRRELPRSAAAFSEAETLIPRIDPPLYEFACQEQNYGLMNVVKGAQTREAEAEAQKK